MPYLQLVLACLGLWGRVQEIDGENLVVVSSALCHVKAIEIDVLMRYPGAEQRLGGGNRP